MKDYFFSKNNRPLTAKVNCVIGGCYFYSSRYNDAIKHLYLALPVLDEYNLVKYQMDVNNKLGIIFSDQGNSKKAIYFFRKNYFLAVKANREYSICSSANNLGVDYNNLGQPNLALYYLNISEKLVKKLKLHSRITAISGNKLESYMLLKDRIKAKEQLDSINAYHLRYGKNDVISFNNFSGQYYRFIGDYRTAIDFYKKNALIIPKNDINELMKNYSGFMECYYSLQDYKNAYLSNEIYYELKDSIASAGNIQKAQELENNYNNFKTEKELEIQKLSNSNKSLQLKRNKAFLILVSSLSLLLIGGIFFFYKLFRDKRKANHLLEEQKSEITHQKKEILDSIYYSKRIQEGILPTENELNQKVGEHFVLYKPKDIVSGDFYWASKKADDSFLIACCDCTGHGVPGAFMSLVAYSLLNKIDEKDQHINPSDILNYLNIELPKFFKKEDPTQQIKDGMDMSLVEIDRKKLKLNYSGANNSIYLIRDTILQVIKADKQPISADVDMRKHIFKNTEIELKKNDMIVMFTDGYADQFGGPTARIKGNLYRQGKKFMYKRLEELLVKNCTADLNSLKQILEKSHLEWRGDLEQIDDVCLIGIRI